MIANTQSPTLNMVLANLAWLLAVFTAVAQDQRYRSVPPDIAGHCLYVRRMGRVQKHSNCVGINSKGKTQMDNHTFEIASQFMLLEEEEFYQMAGSLDSEVCPEARTARASNTHQTARALGNIANGARVSGIGMSTSIRVYCLYVCPYDNESR